MRDRMMQIGALIVILATLAAALAWGMVGDIYFREWEAAASCSCGECVCAHKGA